MDRRTVIENDLVRRYLRGEMDDEERDAFEVFYLTDPDTQDELEIMMAARAHGEAAGTDELRAEPVDLAARRARQDSTEAAPPVTAGGRPRWAAPVALAATLAIGVALGALLGAPGDAGQPPPGAAGLYTIERTRSDDRPTIAVAPGTGYAILRVAVGPTPGAVTTRLVGPADETIEVVGLEPDAYGDVLLVLPAGRLRPGSWELTVLPADGGADPLATFAFTVR